MHPHTDSQSEGLLTLHDLFRIVERVHKNHNLTQITSEGGIAFTPQQVEALALEHLRDFQLLGWATAADDPSAALFTPNVPTFLYAKIAAEALGRPLAPFGPSLMRLPGPPAS